jgi:hypothetical protein
VTYVTLEAVTADTSQAVTNDTPLW